MSTKNLKKCFKNYETNKKTQRNISMILIFDASQIWRKLLPWLKSVNSFMSHSFFKTTEMNTSRSGWLRGKNPSYLHHQTTLSSMEIQIVKCFLQLSICITYWDCSHSYGTNSIYIGRSWQFSNEKTMSMSRHVSIYDGGMPEMGIDAGTRG